MEKGSCFWIYILEVENGNLYTGYTTDIVRRYMQHKKGINCAKYTRSFKPVKIAACWRLLGSKGTALKIEALIKKQTRKEKDKLILSPGILKTLAEKTIDLTFRLFVINPLLVEEKIKKRRIPSRKNI